MGATWNKYSLFQCHRIPSILNCSQWFTLSPCLCSLPQSLIVFSSCGLLLYPEDEDTMFLSNTDRSIMSQETVIFIELVSAWLFLHTYAIFIPCKLKTDKEIHSVLFKFLLKCRARNQISIKIFVHIADFISSQVQWRMTTHIVSCIRVICTVKSPQSVSLTNNIFQHYIKLQTIIHANEWEKTLTKKHK